MTFTELQSSQDDELIIKEITLNFKIRMEKCDWKQTDIIN